MINYGPVSQDSNVDHSNTAVRKSLKPCHVSWESCSNGSVSTNQPYFGLWYLLPVTCCSAHSGGVNALVNVLSKIQRMVKLGLYPALALKQADFF